MRNKVQVKHAGSTHSGYYTAASTLFMFTCYVAQFLAFWTPRQLENQSQLQLQLDENGCG